MATLAGERTASILGHRITPALRDGLIALAMAALFLAYQTYQGFPALADANGDNDSLMRLVEVRDLMAGQGWFDLHQYRLGPDGGIVMHWSRLVDWPIATLIQLGEILGFDKQEAERLALVAWPLMLFAATLMLILRLARRLGGDPALLPAAVIGCMTLYFNGLFEAGTIDHHNFQLLLTLGMLSGMTDPGGRFWPALLAGMCAAGMLAIGMETVPYIAIAGILIAALLLIGGEQERAATTGFGLGLGAGAGALLVATVSWKEWGRPACDAYSTAQASVAVLAGFGIAVVALQAFRLTSLPRRALALAGLGAAIVAMVVIAFPQCLADPYAMVDARLRIYWLDNISETQSVLQTFRSNPFALPGYYATGLLALGVLAHQIIRGRSDRATALIFGTLTGALAVSFWQLRGIMFLMPIAVIPLAAWVGRRRQLAETTPTPARSAAMVGSWLASVAILWALASLNLGEVLGFRDEGEKTRSSRGHGCYARADYPDLAGLPAGTVLAPSNLGSAILAFTPHTALAGAYHRNLAGNTLVLDALMGPLDKVPALIRSHEVNYVAWCHGNGEARMLAKWAPDGLAAALQADRLPAWLEPVPGSSSGGNLRLYRLKPDA